MDTSSYYVGFSGHWFAVGLGYFVGCACVIILDVIAVDPTIIEVIVPVVGEGVFVVIVALVLEVLGHESLRDEQ